MPDESIEPQDSRLLEGNDIIGPIPANDVNAGIADDLSLPSARPDEGEDRDATVAEVQEMFSRRLKERRNSFGNQLSGGGQQMLAIGRAITLNPNVLLLDEPAERLAPIIVDELLRAPGTIARSGGICSIIVEQHAQKILGLADRVVILERGAIVHDAAGADGRKVLMMANDTRRHCEEQRDEAIQDNPRRRPDCFAFARNDGVKCSMNDDRSSGVKPHATN